MGHIRSVDLRIVAATKFVPLGCDKMLWRIRGLGGFGISEFLQVSDQRDDSRPVAGDGLVIAGFLWFFGGI